MKKKFLRQDYFRHKRLGKKWRRPKGRQSKLRKRKSGSGLVVKIGHGSSNRGMINNLQPVIVSNPNDMDSIKDKQIVIISSVVGAKKALAISDKAKKLGLKILNPKKIKRAERIVKEIETKRKKKEAEKKEAAKKKAEEKKKEIKEKKKEGDKEEKKEEQQKETKEEEKKIEK